MAQQIAEQDVIYWLENSNPSDLVKVLQFLLKNKQYLRNEEIFNRIELLTKQGEIGTKFWAKKIFNDLGKYAFPEKAEQANQSKNQLNISKELPVEILIQKLRSVDSTFVSLDIIKKLCESKKEEALELLKPYLQSCKDKVQISYLTKNLGINFPSDEMLSFLMPFLKHEDDRIVANTIEGIEAINSPKCIVVLSQMLSHSNNRVKSNAAKAIAAQDLNQAIGVFEKMLSGNSGDHFKISACHAIKCLKNKSLIPLLASVLSNDIVFPYALDALEGIGGKSVIEMLTEKYASFPKDKQEFIDETIVRLNKSDSKFFGEMASKVDTTKIFSKINDFTDGLREKLDSSTKSSPPKNSRPSNQGATQRNELFEKVIGFFSEPKNIAIGILLLLVLWKFTPSSSQNLPTANPQNVNGQETNYQMSTYKPRENDKSGPTWEKFDSIFSISSKTSDFQKEEAWKEWKGKKVVWSGEVVEVSKSGWSNNLNLTVKMKHDTFTFDVSVHLNNDQKALALKLRKGANVKYSGNLQRYGGAVLPTELNNGKILN
jgi:hypothetical protein